MALVWDEARMAVELVTEAGEAATGDYPPGTLVISMRKDQVDDHEFIDAIRMLVVTRIVCGPAADLPARPHGAGAEGPADPRLPRTQGDVAPGSPAAGYEGRFAENYLASVQAADRERAEEEEDGGYGCDGDWDGWDGDGGGVYGDFRYLSYPDDPTVRIAISDCGKVVIC